ncbi:DUF6308 family protein [Micromonospora inaquosa]|uniref:DUF6308 family protein n=1 Tax=Micromonospora inaquosa TaxID=2203716 RepID=UPI0033F59FE0
MSAGWLELPDIIAVLDDERSLDDLRRYFATGPKSCLFTGSKFEALGGDPKGMFRDVVTAEDLIAVEMLSVRVPPMVALELLQGELGQQVSDELREIPIAVDLSAEGAKPYIDDNGPADRAWHHLTGCRGVNKTIAGKLLARKRPRLIPVYDNVVACALRGRRGFWLWLHEQLRVDGLRMAHRLRRLRAEAGIPALVSEIRVLDVVIWMRHQPQHQRKNCPGMTVPSRAE